MISQPPSACCCQNENVARERLQIGREKSTKVVTARLKEKEHAQEKELTDSADSECMAQPASSDGTNCATIATIATAEEKQNVNKSRFELGDANRA